MQRVLHLLCNGHAKTTYNYFDKKPSQYSSTTALVDEKAPFPTNSNEKQPTPGSADNLTATDSSVLFPAIDYGSDPEARKLQLSHQLTRFLSARYNSIVPPTPISSLGPLLFHTKGKTLGHIDAVKHGIAEHNGGVISGNDYVIHRPHEIFLFRDASFFVKQKPEYRRPTPDGELRMREDCDVGLKIKGVINLRDVTSVSRHASQDRLDIEFRRSDAEGLKRDEVDGKDAEYEVRRIYVVFEQGEDVGEMLAAVGACMRCCGGKEVVDAL